MLSISIVGVGRVGGSLALALANNGYKIDALIQKRPATIRQLAKKIRPEPVIINSQSNFKINSDIVFITVPDAEIENVAYDLAEHISGKPFVFHTSGALSSNILSPLKSLGCKIGSIHPVASISSADLGATRFRGSYFGVEGDAPAVKLARNIVADLGGKSFRIDAENKTLYHTAAVTACGHVTALVDLAFEMMAKAGLTKSDAKKILIPLIRSTIDNIEIQNAVNALTGTFARADDAALDRQIAAFNGKLTRSEIEIYLDLALRSLKLAEKRGVNRKNIALMRKRISLAKRKLK